MNTFPSEVRVFLTRSPKAKMFAAMSDDLPGLLTVGGTIEEIEERLAPSIVQLIKAQWGVDVNVTLVADDEDDDGFRRLDEPRVLELHAA